MSKSSSNGNHIRFCAPENVTMSRIKNWEELALKGSHFAQKREEAEKGRERPRKAEKGRKNEAGAKSDEKRTKKKSEEKKEKKSFKRVAPVDKQAL